MFRHRGMRVVLSIGGALLVCMLCTLFGAARQAKAISDGVVRFHIVANSDTEADQQMKIAVRDGIAELTEELFSVATTKAEALEIARTHREELQSAAEQVLRRQGCAHAVRVEIRQMYFPTKQYEDITLPAGHYDAIHVTLGEGKGQNFWCVMFPALCLPSVSEDNAHLLSSVLQREQVELVTHPYTLKFKTAEWLGKLYRLFA